MYASPGGGAPTTVPGRQEHRQHRPGEQVQRSHQTAEERHCLRSQFIHVTLYVPLLLVSNISVS